MWYLVKVKVLGCSLELRLKINKNVNVNIMVYGKFISGKNIVRLVVWFWLNKMIFCLNF